MDVDSVRLFIASKGNWFMIEIAQIFAEGLRGNGVPVELEFDTLPEKTSHPGLLQIVVAPHEFYPLFLEEEVSASEVIEVTKTVYFLTVEQPGSSWFEISCRYARYAKGIFDINVQGVKEFEQRGLPATHAPLGYSSCLESEPIAADSRRRVTDILYMGASSHKREVFLSRNASFFNRYNCKLILNRVNKPRLVSTPGFYTDFERNSFLSSSKILINVHSGDRSYLEWHRILIAIANRCLVISEISEDIEPLIHGRHLILAELQDIPATCQYYLEHDHERAQLAEQAYKFIKEECSSILYCKSILKHLETGTLQYAPQ